MASIPLGWRGPSPYPPPAGGYSGAGGAWPPRPSEGNPPAGQWGPNNPRYPQPSSQAGGQSFTSQVCSHFHTKNTRKY